MNVDILKVGELETNCYLVYKDDKCLIIDPGDNENFIVSRIREKNLQVKAILVTHDHEDHNKLAKSLSTIYGAPIYDYNNLFEGPFKIDEFSFDVIYTKGHTSSSISFYFKDYDIMFVGDFIFYEGVGRTDLKTGSYSELLESIRKIKQYSPDTVIYPGHGKTTTLEHEMKYNKYFDI